MSIQQHSILFVSNGCSCECRFCTRSEGRLGDAPGEVDVSAVCGSRTVTIMAGDLLTESLAGTVTKIRASGTRDVFVYAHPACGLDHVMALRDLHEAGATGLHLMLPASDRHTLKSICGPAASLLNSALLIRAANSLRMKVFLEVPVMAQNVESLDDTVNRAWSMIDNLSGVNLPFRAIHDDSMIKRWNFRDGLYATQAVADRLTAAGVAVTLGGFEGPAPCVMNLAGAVPEWYPELDGPIDSSFQRPVVLDVVCAECDAMPACSMRMHAFRDDGVPVEPIRRTTTPSSPVRSADLFIRKVDLDRLISRAARVARCPAPWDSLEMHDRTGRVSPCEGSWARRDILGTPDAERGGWLTEGAVRSFNSPGMIAMRRAMVSGGRQASCNTHCPRFSQTWSSGPPVRLPRTDVFFKNLSLNLEEFIEGAQFLESLPLNITFSPSLRCNQHCRMCDLYDDDAGPAGIDTPGWIFDEIESLLPTTGTLALTGGEPLLSSRIIKMVESITPDRLPDTRVTITTNGTLLNEKLINRFKRSNIATVFISLNADGPEMHELVTGVGGRFDLVIKNAAALIDAAREMPFSPSVIFSFVVMRSTIDGLERFLAVAEEVGAGVRLLPIERDRNSESIFTDPDTLLRAESIVKNALERYAGRRQIGGELERLRGLLRMMLESGAFRPI